MGINPPKTLSPEKWNGCSLMTCGPSSKILKEKVNNNKKKGLLNMKHL